ncbi:ESPR-type extended signal peptide-containing protein, partial [Burkholderia ubonensis]
MNKIYKTIWNKALGVFVAASELDRSQGGAVASSATCKPVSRSFFASTPFIFLPFQGGVLTAIAASVLGSMAPQVAWSQALGSGVATGNGATAISSPNGCSPASATAAISTTSNTSIAIGCGATSSGSGGSPIAIGWAALASGVGLSAGYNNSPIAIGDSATATGFSATALGNRTAATDAGAIAVGSLASATGQNSTVVGSRSTASGTQSTAIGFGNTVSGNSSGAFGDPNSITGNGSYAVGNNNTIDANNAFVVGNGVSIPTGMDGAVALGDSSAVALPNKTSSTTIGGQTYSFAGTNPSSVVSVGALNRERQITNVAAGQVSATSTDAINGSQLNAAVTAINSLSTSASTGISTAQSGVNSLSTGLSTTNSNVASLST